VNFKAALPLAAVVFSLSTALYADEPRRHFGDTQAFAALPYAFPEGVVVSGHTAYVSGPATFGTAGQGPSYIHAFDTATGARVTTISVAGEDLTQEHALSCITTDGLGRLYALSTQLGVVRIDTQTGAQTVYATIPHLAACNALPPGPCKVGDWSCLPPGPCTSGRCLPPGPCTPNGLGQCLPPGPCAPVAADRGSLPNDLAFDDAGNLYITDSFQATIFRVAPGGGQAEAFYQDARLDTSTIPGFALGLNGIRVSPDRSKLIFTQTFGINAGVLSLPLMNHPPPYTLQMVRPYQNGELPDGLAFGASGRLYVTLAGSNQIGLIDHAGHEFYRISSPSFDNPANVGFDAAGSLLVTNHALFGNPADGGVFNTFVGDLASPLAQPMIP
jgi:hypothetical protein